MVDLQQAPQFEEGLKQNIAWRRQQGDTSRWDTWELVRGERLDLYLTTSGNHT